MRSKLSIKPSFWLSLGALLLAVIPLMQIFAILLLPVVLAAIIRGRSESLISAYEKAFKIYSNEVPKLFGVTPSAVQYALAASLITSMLFLVCAFFVLKRKPLARRIALWLCGCGLAYHIFGQIWRSLSVGFRWSSLEDSAAWAGYYATLLFIFSRSGVVELFPKGREES